MQIIDALDAKNALKTLSDDELKVREANTYAANRMKQSIEEYLKPRMGTHIFNSLGELFKKDEKGFVEVNITGNMVFVNFYDGDDENGEDPTTVSGTYHPSLPQCQHEIDILRSILEHERFGEVMISMYNKI
jgi:hypothetical protein